MSTVEQVVPEWTVGDRLAKARLIAGLDQQQMADAFGVSRPTISKWERDEAQPRNMLAVIHQWSDITDVPSDWLLGLRSRWSSERVLVGASAA